MKKIKGFTLVECIIALAILAIASLTMAQIYAGVASRNIDNHNLNTSLSKQMAYVEKYINAEAYEIAYDGTAGSTQPPHVGSPKARYVKIENSISGTKYEYSYPADIYILYSRDYNDKDSKDGAAYKGETEDNYNLRYKYVLGHTT